MAGGPRGPAPKRPEQRRRRNKPQEGLEPDVVHLPRSGEAEGAPPPCEDWHASVLNLYLSLERSGQSQFYEPSDWAFARPTCDLLSRQLLSEEKINAALIGTLMSSLDRLLVAEADRRRARLILERDDEPEEAPSVAIMEKYRKAAGDS